MKFETNNVRLLMRLIRSDHSAFLHKVATDLSRNTASDLTSDTGISAKVKTLSSGGEFEVAKGVQHQAPSNASKEDQAILVQKHQKLLQDLASEEEFAKELRRIGLY